MADDTGPSQPNDHQESDGMMPVCPVIGSLGNLCSFLYS
jgi:hypothetical protein